MHRACPGFLRKFEKRSKKYTKYFFIFFVFEVAICVVFCYDEVIRLRGTQSDRKKRSGNTVFSSRTNRILRNLVHATSENAIIRSPPLLTTGADLTWAYFFDFVKLFTNFLTNFVKSFTNFCRTFGELCETFHKLSNNLAHRSYPAVTCL